MSVVVDEHSRLQSRAAPRLAIPDTWPRRWIIGAAGCLAMALSGVGLGVYLDTSSAVAAETSQDSGLAQTAATTPPADALQGVASPS